MKRNTLVESGDFYAEDAHKRFKWNVVKDCHSQKNQLHLYLPDQGYKGVMVYRLMQRVGMSYDMNQMLHHRTNYFNADNYKMAIICLATESSEYNTSDTLIASEIDRIVFNFPSHNTIKLKDLRSLVLEAITLAYVIYFESLANVLGEKAFSTLIESVDRVEFI